MPSNAGIANGTETQTLPPGSVRAMASRNASTYGLSWKRAVTATEPSATPAVTW
jgi:hypothetical protein